MMPALVSLLTIFRDSFRTRVALQAEILALRHQLLIFQRKNQKQRLRLSVADRLLWVWLSRVWTDWRSALRIVKPETVIAWHRKGFRLYWSSVPLICFLETWSLALSYPSGGKGYGPAGTPPARVARAASNSMVRTHGAD